MDKIVGLSDVLISLINNVLMGNLQKIVPLFSPSLQKDECFDVYFFFVRA